MCNDVYKIEYKASKNSKATYVCADLKSTDGIGFTWTIQDSASEAKKKAAKNMGISPNKLKIRSFKPGVLKPGEILLAPESKREVLIEDITVFDSKNNTGFIKTKPSNNRIDNDNHDDNNGESSEPEINDENDVIEQYDKTMQAIVDVGNVTKTIAECVDLCNIIIQTEDLREEDFMHYIENYSIGAAEQSHLFKRFKESRIRRRKAKDLRNTLNCMIGCKNQILLAANTAEKAINNEAIYHPRIEKELFEKKEGMLKKK